MPKKAFLPQEVIQQAYLELSKQYHPDQGGDPQLASSLNEAYETLRSPDKRLKHLLQLQNHPELQAWRAVPMGEDLMKIFTEVGKITQMSNSLLNKVAKSEGAISRAILTPQILQSQKALEELNISIQEKLDQLEVALQEWDKASEEAPPQWKDLSEIQVQFAYLLKWQSQVKAQLLELMTALI